MPKHLWLSVHRRNLAEQDGSAEARFSTGHEVGAVGCRCCQMVEAKPDLAAMFALTRTLPFYPFTGRAVEAMAGVADPRLTQPITFARADARPMLLVTSSADTTVRPRNTARLAGALRAREHQWKRAITLASATKRS
jgi:hypothetical protein